MFYLFSCIFWFVHVHNLVISFYIKLSTRGVIKFLVPSIWWFCKICFAFSLLWNCNRAKPWRAWTWTSWLRSARLKLKSWGEHIFVQPGKTDQNRCYWSGFRSLLLWLFFIFGSGLQLFEPEINPCPTYHHCSSYYVARELVLDFKQYYKLKRIK